MRNLITKIYLIKLFSTIFDRKGSLGFFSLFPLCLLSLFVDSHMLLSREQHIMSNIPALVVHSSLVDHPLHSTLQLAKRHSFILAASILFQRKDTQLTRSVLLRPMAMTYHMGVILPVHPSFSFLSLNCSYSDFSCLSFLTEVSHNYFFRRKVSASRILQVPDTLFLGFFQKLFAVCRASNKNFSRPKGEIIR